MSRVEIKLADLCEVITKGTTPSNIGAEFTEDGIKYIRSEMLTSSKYITEDGFLYISEDTHNKLKRSQLKAGDILFSMAGVYLGKTAILRECDVPSNTNQAVALIRVIPEKCNREFVYYYLNLPEVVKSVNSITGQAAQPNINLKQIGSIPILLPSREIQDQIVFLVSAYDDLIENNQKQIKLLEEAAQRLYKEWFVDLRFPGHETTPITDGIPEGWEDKVMEDLCDSIGGGTPSTKNDEYYRDGQIKWVTPTDITRKNGLILLDTEKKITEEGLQHSSAKMVPPYTILMTSRASVGFFGLCEHEVCTNQGFISCIPYKENTRYYLLYNLMNRVDEIRAKASGSTFLEISKKNFRGLRIVLPTDSVLDEFTKLVFPMVRQMETLTKSIATLQEARDRLLPKLMNGEIEV